MCLIWFLLFISLAAFPVLPPESVAQTTLASVLPQFETPPLFDDEAGGNADGDDPAIWVHPQHLPLSLVIVTKKNAGLSVYTLRGHELQAIATPPAPGPNDAPGRFNNVDILYGFQLGDRTVDLAVTTDRGRDQLRFYAIELSDGGDRTAPLQDVTSAHAPFVFSVDQAQVNEQRTAYGLAVAKEADGTPYAFVSQRERTVIAKVQLLDAGDGMVTYQVVNAITLPKSFTLPNGVTWEPCGDPGEEPQVEGMVVDSGRHVLYAAQEDVGIWRIQVSLIDPVLIDRVREYGVPWEFDAVEEECTILSDQDPGFGGQHLSADAEGLTIYYGPALEGYVLASSQGDNTFAVYERQGDSAYRGSFEVDPAPKRAIDRVQDSDGAAVINVPLNAAFHGGLLVVHDGENTPEVLDDAGDVRPNTNFKFIRWEDIARSFTPPLLIDPHSWHPRQ
jgi:3-phytase